MSALRGIHHVAYRCRDAAETVRFYQDMLGMAFTTAFAEDRVPSTQEPDPYMHVFLDAGRGNVLAFFELPTREPMGRDPHTPTWVQHIGIEVVGPTDHGLFKSIYFFDPNGHRLELTVDTATPEMTRRAREVAPAMLEEWSRTKRAPRHAAFLHEAEFGR
jgi:catechol 2,3-dioxygenase-like lactoylglutathione lyase family enzyme